MRQVFISYKSEEATQAEKIVKALEDRGIRCWIAPRNIPLGSDYANSIPDAIEECPCFLLLLSRNAQDSAFIKKELAWAIKLKRRILPLMLEDFQINKNFLFLLEDVQIRRYYENRTEYLREVAELIRAACPPQLTPEEAYRRGKDCAAANNYREAVEYYTMAAQDGHASAQCDLGICYEMGRGVTPDIQQAVHWYSKSAEQENPYGQANLALCYAYAKGVDKNPAKAFRLFEAAAKSEHDGAQMHLGNCYENGIGVDRDLSEAERWYQKSAQQGNTYAEKKLAQLKTK